MDGIGYACSCNILRVGKLAGLSAIVCNCLLQLPEADIEGLQLPSHMHQPSGKHRLQCLAVQ